MDQLNKLHSFLLGENLSIPLWEVLVFITINSICLLFGRNKSGLIISYCFAFYWGFIFNVKHFINVAGQSTWGMTVYVLSGVIMVCVIFTGFFVESRD
jgi:hypothetical protein